MTPEQWKRLREIFDSALERSSGADEFARAECGSDAELYSQLHRMLQEHPRTSPLDQPPVAVMAVRAASSPVFREGQLVAGRYRIVRYLSCGGMGEVYEADDLELPEMKEHVALKTLLPAIASDETMVARFKQEIALSRKVQHPNVCAAFDLSRHEVEGSEAILFLTMRFLPGETLAARLARVGRMDPGEALPLLEQMADALDAAHRAGVIHRDFKPSNVMLVPTAEGVHAVVTDFGLARRLTTGFDTTSTLSGQVMGTLDYMAPELLTGSTASSASDVYGLGMVAYKMFTGTLPFAAETPLAAAILRANQPIPSPRTRRPDLDPKCEQAILRALDANPANRFSRAGQFLQELRGEPVSMTLRLPRLTRRRALAAVLAVLATAAAVVGWRSWESQRNRPPAEAAVSFRIGVEDIHAGAYFAATKALGRAVQIAPRFSLAHARLAEAWMGLEMPEKASQEMLLARRQDNSGLPAIDQLEIEAVDLTITREFPAAILKYERMIKIQGEAEPGLYVDLGRAYENAGKPDQAIASYRRAAEGPSHNPAAWLRLAVLYNRASNATQSDDAFQQAAERYQQSSNLEGMIEVAYLRGTAAYRTGQLAESAAYYRKALETAHYAGNLQQEIRAMLQLGTNAYLVGDVDAAERYAREALESARANQMETLAISGIVSLGNICTQKRDFACAEKNYQEALTLARRNESPKLTALSLLSLSTLHDQVGRYDDSSREAQQALTYYQSNRFVDETLKALTLVGRADYHRGRNAAALDSFRHLLDFAEKKQSRPLIALAHESIGLVYSRQERYPEALEQYKKNLELSTDPLQTGYARLQCGDALCMLGRLDEAVSMFDQAGDAAAKFPQLKLSLLRARAEMDLNQNRFAQASERARRLLADAGLKPSSAAELKTVLGLALLGSGKASEGLRMCEEALAASARLGEDAGLLQASLAVLQARIATRDKAGALAIFHQVEPMLGGFPESRWRALALVSRADSQFSARARQALDELAGSWGKETFRAYLARPDIKQLSRPLLQSTYANR